MCQSAKERGFCGIPRAQELYSIHVRQVQIWQRAPCPVRETEPRLRDPVCDSMWGPARWVWVCLTTSGSILQTSFPPAPLHFPFSRGTLVFRASLWALKYISGVRRSPFLYGTFLYCCNSISSVDYDESLWESGLGRRC